MILCRRPLILLTDLVGAVGAVGILALVAATVAVPMVREWHSQPAVESELARTRDAAAGLQRRRAKLAGELRDTTEAIRSEAPQPLADVGKLLERIAAQCAASEVELLEVTPSSNATEHRAAVLHWQARVQARGAFPRLFSLLRDLESWSPYLEIRDLSMTGAPKAGTSICEANWMLRVSYLRASDELSRMEDAESNP